MDVLPKEIKKITMKKQQKVYLIANAHIDPIWLWDEEEGLFSALSTFRSAVNLLDEYDFIFCHNEAYIYEKIEKLDKELFAKIKQAIKLGKWVIMGGWFLQPDCLMPTGESIVRQILVGKKYFLDKFGVEPNVAVNLDPFGHDRGIVQIIKKCNQNGYIVTRPSSENFDFPSDCFIWEGYDGSQLKVYHCGSYSTPLGYARYLIEKEIDKRKDNSEPFIKLWGVGNHGGGPSRKDLTDIENLNRESGIELNHSTPDVALSQIDAIGTVKTSLRKCNPGCYVSMSSFKRKYLEVESLYYEVEKMASVASISNDYEYPQEKLTLALKNIMLCQFHDLLPGTCIEDGEKYGMSLLGAAEVILREIRLEITQMLCGYCKCAKEKEYPIFVFNSSPYARNAYIESELCVIPQCEADEESFIHIKDENGKELVCQQTKPRANINMDWRKRIGYYAELKPLSFNRFDVFVTYKKIKKSKLKQTLTQNYVVEGNGTEIEFNYKTGSLCRYTVNGTNYINYDSFELFAYEDNEDPWGMNKSQMQIGVNPQPFEIGGIGVFEEQKSIKIVEDGDLFVIVESLYHFKQTQAVVQYKVYKKVPRVDVRVSVLLANKNIAVKVHIPMQNKNLFVGQIFGEELLTLNEESVAQKYIRIPFGDSNLGVVMQNSYAVSYDAETIKMPILRGTTFCAHPIGNREIIERDRYIPTMDTGLNEFNFSLIVANENIVSQCLEISNPYSMQLFPCGEKSLKPFNITIGNNQIQLVSIKKSEGKNSYIVRLFNAGEDVVVDEFIFDNKKIKLKFAKFEVKTIEVCDQLCLESKNLLI